MAIKLVALDLDGTTINNDRVISQRNRDAMTEAARRGVNIVVATGRPLGALPKDVFEIEGIRYAADIQRSIHHGYPGEYHIL